VITDPGESRLPLVDNRPSGNDVMP
jgi:hypothetical protein